jgi:release factor glutamine methyltransferase
MPLKASTQHDFQLPEQPGWKRARRRFAKSVLAWRYRHFTPESQDQRIVKVAGIRLQVSRGVFDPSMHFTSGLLASYLLQGSNIIRGSTVLDVGTGSGIAAIAAARAGAANVVALDINPGAVECARLNALQNDVSPLIDARESDLFSAVAGERFDLVVCNPPYFKGEPATMAERAFLGGKELEWITRFATELDDHLTPQGFALLSIGDAADIPAIVSLLNQCGWLCTEVEHRDILVETIYIIKLNRNEEVAADAG